MQDEKRRPEASAPNVNVDGAGFAVARVREKNNQQKNVAIHVSLGFAQLTDAEGRTNSRNKQLFRLLFSISSAGLKLSASGGFR